MSKYIVSHRIRTVVENAVFPENNYSKPWFEVEGIRFEQWKFDHSNGWGGDSWLAIYEIESNNAIYAVNFMREKLSKIVPRISLIAQSYISFTTEPFMIQREDKEYFFLHYVRDDDPVGLMYNDKNQDALRKLLSDKTVNEEFYYFWNDATNTAGTSAKILLMCSAIANLTKKPNGKNDYAKIENILGIELKDKLFAPRIGLRQRLSHGEYIADKDWETDFVSDIHKGVVKYFNNEILKSELITEDVVQPQRNFIGNKSSGSFYFWSNDRVGHSLRAVLDEFNKKKGDLNLIDFEFVTDDDKIKDF